ncbi:hypothetical protein F5888DRAFT_1799717 [Russula emetica]|nr:hypothetical protein F5888DRAFT_1799717 [Russula emetica]
MSTSGPSLSSTPFDIPSNSSPSSTKRNLSSSAHSSASSKYAPEIVALKRHISTVESLIYDIILQPPHAPPTPPAPAPSARSSSAIHQEYPHDEKATESYITIAGKSDESFKLRWVRTLLSERDNNQSPL